MTQKVIKSDHLFCQMRATAAGGRAISEHGKATGFNRWLFAVTKNEGTPEARLKKGFTLIELLVVIAIIALLLAIILPALSAVKDKAKSVICRTNLHQWGLSYQLYTNDWDNKLPEFDMVENPFGSTYMESLRGYYGDLDKIRTCPTATKIAPVGWATWGGDPADRIPGQTFRAWYAKPSEVIWQDEKDSGIGSYGENAWIRTKWKSIVAMKSPSTVPLMLDARWHNDFPGDRLLTRVDTEEQFYSGKWYTIATYAMRRHGKGVCLVLADMSAVPVEAEELWSLNWHKDFERKSPDDIDLSWINW